MSEYELEDVIKLSEDCCGKKDLLVYAVTHEWTCGGESDMYLVCSNCWTKYRWDCESPRAWKLIKISDNDLYEEIEYAPRFLKEVKDKHPKGFNNFVKKLNLDKDKLEKILEK